jgi:hypothetical protein
VGEVSSGGREVSSVEGGKETSEDEDDDEDDRDPEAEISYIQYPTLNAQVRGTNPRSSSL